MGLTFVDATVTGPTGKSETLELLIDRGASYSLLPTKVWKALKLKPMEKQTFTLADGTHVDRKISECRIRLNSKERHTPVILGEAGDEPLLGVVTHPRPQRTPQPSGPDRCGTHQRGIRLAPPRSRAGDPSGPRPRSLFLERNTLQ